MKPRLHYPVPHLQHNSESNNVESSLIPIIASEKKPLPSLVMNASNDDNNNTITKINNQNISVASSSSPSLHANVIQVNADFNNDGFDDLAIGVPMKMLALLMMLVLSMSSMAPLLDCHLL